LCFRSIEAQQKPVIKVSRIVHTIFIEQQGISKCADFQQAVPVTRVPRQTGNLQAQHQTRMAQTDLAHQALKARPLGGGSARLAEIRVDDHDLFHRPA